jgi:hypothetical protein
VEVLKGRGSNSLIYYDETTVFCSFPILGERGREILCSDSEQFLFLSVKTPMNICTIPNS